MAGWNIEAKTKLSCTSKEACEIVSDFRNAPVIPGVESARLVSGKDRQPGSIYNCRGSLGEILGISVNGTLEIVVKENDACHSIEIGLTGIDLPGIALKKGSAKWKFTDTEDGCEAILETEGEVDGIIFFAPIAEGYLENTMVRQVTGTLQNLKERIKNSVPVACT